MGDTLLDQTLVIKDLGVDNQLKFREQTAAVVAKRRTTVIRQYFGIIDETTLPTLFRTMARPCPEYANAVWGPFYRED